MSWGEREGGRGARRPRQGSSETPRTLRTLDCGQQGRLRNPDSAWVQAFPEPTPCGFRLSRNPRPVGSGSPGTHTLWVQAFPEPTPCGFRDFRNPHPVGSGVSGTHARGFRVFRNPRLWVPEFPEPTPSALCGFGVSEPTLFWSFIFRGCVGIRSSVFGVLGVSGHAPGARGFGVLSSKATRFLGFHFRWVNYRQSEGERCLGVSRHRLLALCPQALTHAT